MNSVVRFGAVSLLVVLLAGCDYGGPTSPAATNIAPAPPSLPPVPPPVPQVPFPPLSGPSRTFIAHGIRLVLYDNGAFGLQYPEFTYRGAYKEVNGVFMFQFGSSSGGTVDEFWDDAIGTLEGDSLTVVYSDLLQQADFANDVFVLVP